MTVLPNRRGLVIQKNLFSFPNEGISSSIKAVLSTKYVSVTMDLYFLYGAILFKNIPIPHTPFWQK